MIEKKNKTKSTAKVEAALSTNVESSASKLPLIICAALALATLAGFSRVVTCDFVNYDDLGYITNNPEIQRGLNWDSIKWAFTTGAQSNWHPQTWLSHMLDFQFYGLKAAGHHATNVLWHTANAVLLFLIFNRMTGAVWRSAFVAAIFALHPMRAESVAWVSERKDVLSTFFWMLTVWAYVRYAEMRAGEQVRKRESGSSPSRSLSHFLTFYFLALLFFALGLMSKPMLVTLPFVLLLLDFWPLRRVTGDEGRGVNEDKDASPVTPRPSVITPLLWEKIPFFLVAITSSVITFFVQRHGGAVSSLTGLSISQRIANALISYCRYIAKTFWPAKLSVLYPHPGHWPIWQILLAALFLVAITALVIWRMRARPYLAVGWFWFLGMLVPAIGLVQVGIQSMADRYSYVPAVGLSIMLAWGLTELLAPLSRGKLILSIAGGLAAAICLVLTPIQIGYWKNSETLFTHAIQVTDKNYLAYNNLGYFLSNRDDHKGENTDNIKRAMEFYRKAIEIEPKYEDAHNNLGYALAALGQYHEAIEEYKKSLTLRPNLVEAHNNLGNALSNIGELNAAITEYTRALAQDPKHADSHNNFGIALAMQGKLDEAIDHFHQAVRNKANYSSAHSNLGNAYAAKGQYDDAIREYHECLRINPDDFQAHNNLGNVFAQQDKIEEAVQEYRTALKLRFENPEAHFNLGFTLAKQNKRGEAESEFLEALRQKPDYAAAQQQLNLLRGPKP